MLYRSACPSKDERRMQHEPKSLLEKPALGERIKTKYPHCNSPSWNRRNHLAIDELVRMPEVVGS
jgi:hypothetical protein